MSWLSIVGLAAAVSLLLLQRFRIVGPEATAFLAGAFIGGFAVRAVYEDGWLVALTALGLTAAIVAALRYSRRRA